MEVEHAPIGLPYNSAKTLLRRSGDMDYNDVFGGPPRRFSMQEVRIGRYGLGGTVIEEEVDEEEEKDEEVDRVSTPVFGEETTPRRRNPGGNFFDDIFGGDENYVSPRNRDRNGVFGSNLHSTSFSPTKSKSEQFGTSPPAKFSPAKFNKVELPAFAHSQYKQDISTNALISPRFSTPLSRFSSQTIRSIDDIKNEAHLQRQSSLPREACFRLEDTPNIVASPKSKKDRKSFDGSNNQFYNSIYRWASGKGISMINLMGRSSPKSKGRIGKCASFNGRVESKPSIVANGGSFVHTEPEHLEMEPEKKDPRSKDEGIIELENSAEDVQGAEDVSGEAKQNTKLERRKSHAEIRIKERIARQVPMGMNESPMSEVMPTLRTLLIAESEIEGMFVNNTTTPRKDDSDPGECSNKNEQACIDEDCKSSLHAETVEVNSGKKVAAGKVKEMVQIFDQEVPRRKDDAYERSESHRWKATGTDQKENVNENQKKDERQQHFQRTKIPTTENDDLSANQNTVSLSESFLWDSTSVENLDKSLEGNFMVDLKTTDLVEQLSKDIDEVAQESEALEDITATDVKIQQWSVGKEGNIRSILSTLQYILWPGSGWNPIPLVELIEANSVKRAYQKALLRLHPDKLQQNSAASLHKYTAEKIFDILQLVLFIFHAGGMGPFQFTWSTLTMEVLNLLSKFAVCCTQRSLDIFTAYKAYVVEKPKCI